MKISVNYYLTIKKIEHLGKNNKKYNSKTMDYISVKDKGNLVSFASVTFEQIFLMNF